MNHEVSISGGSEKSSFFTSFGYSDIKGVVASPITDTVAQSDFLPSANYRPLVTRDASGRYYGVSKYVAQEIKNPLAVIKNSLGNYNWDHNIVGNAYLDITPAKGLNIHSSFGTKVAFFGSEIFTPTVYYSAANTGSPNNLKRDENWLVNWNVENTVSYNKIFDRHNITLLAGWGEYKDGNARGATIQYNNLPATNFAQASFQFNALAADRQSSSGSDGTDHRINSLFSRLQYNYDQKYLLTALIRRDGSSRFSDNHKFGYFPSVSVGWVPTLESFFPSSKVINTLKIRASYGVTGTDILPEFSYVDLIGAGGQRNYTFGTGDNLYIGYKVNNDFLKILKDNFPLLTPTDLKLCAYLRLNLSTKAIADLLNLSIRGVESSRYRLRKKLNLSNDISLSDYLSSVST